MEHESSVYPRFTVSERETQEDWINRVVNNPQSIEVDKVGTELEHRLGVIPE